MEVLERFISASRSIFVCGIFSFLFKPDGLSLSLSLLPLFLFA
jgi:hypothetical protein